MSAKVLTSHLFNHLDLHKGNANMLEMVKANVYSKLRDLYELDPFKRTEIIAKLDDVQNHIHLDQNSFFTLLHTRLEEIKMLLDVEQNEIKKIDQTVSELIHFVRHQINGRIL